MSRDADLRIEACLRLDHAGWLGLRQALWPHDDAQAHREEMARFLSEPVRFRQWVARLDGLPVGLAEVSIRSDYVLGTDSPPPIGFLEGLYVAPQARRRGIACALVAAGEAWARSQGCKEFASDALLDNTLSHAVHRALGFAETERVVCFRRALRSD